MRQVMAAAATALVSALLLAGCTGPGNEPRPTQSASIASGQPQIPGQSPGVTGATDVPTNLKNDATKRADVDLQSCKKIAGGWEARGTVKNHSSTPQEYSIVVFFADKNGTVIDWKETAFTVDKKKSDRWSAKQEFAAASTTRCVVASVS